MLRLCPLVNASSKTLSYLILKHFTTSSVVCRNISMCPQVVCFGNHSGDVNKKMAAE